MPQDIVDLIGKGLWTDVSKETINEWRRIKRANDWPAELRELQDHSEVEGEVVESYGGLD